MLVERLQNACNSRIVSCSKKFNLLIIVSSARFFFYIKCVNLSATSTVNITKIDDCADVLTFRNELNFASILRQTWSSRQTCVYKKDMRLQMVETLLFK